MEEKNKEDLKTESTINEEAEDAQETPAPEQAEEMEQAAGDEKEGAQEN